MAIEHTRMLGVVFYMIGMLPFSYYASQVSSFAPLDVD